MFSFTFTKLVILSILFVNVTLTHPIITRDVPGSNHLLSSTANAQAIANMQKGLSPAGETGVQVAASIGRPPDGDSGLREAAERAQGAELPLDCGQLLNECIAQAYDKGSKTPGGEAAVQAGLAAFAAGPSVAASKPNPPSPAAASGPPDGFPPPPGAVVAGAPPPGTPLEPPATEPRKGAQPGSTGVGKDNLGTAGAPSTTTAGGGATTPASTPSAASTTTPTVAPASTDFFTTLLKALGLA